jgi:aspartate/methionine/tyrosine aminotransferase
MKMASHKGGALFLVQPNNPTGYCLQESELLAIATQCRQMDKILILDNSFRLYNRVPFDDYSLLTEVGVSFISLEDTGKVWPSHDLKASLLFCSPDLEELVGAIYSELYLCHSRFSLLLLEQFSMISAQEGLKASVWDTVDLHRVVLRHALAGTTMDIDPSSHASMISVEWLNCSRTGLHDLDVLRMLARSGVLVLPGRLFYWNTGVATHRQQNIRVALMKPEHQFLNAVAVMARVMMKS